MGNVNGSGEKVESMATREGSCFLGRPWERSLDRKVRRRPFDVLNDPRPRAVSRRMLRRMGFSSASAWQQVWLLQPPRGRVRACPS